MALGKKTGGRNFEPGNKMAQGRPSLPEEVREARQYTRAHLIEAITKYLDMPLSELKLHAKDESLPSSEHMIIRIVMNGIMKGDNVRFDFLLDRIQGKVKQVVENIGDPRPQASQLDELHKHLVSLIMMDKKEPEVKEAQGLISGDT